MKAYRSSVTWILQSPTVNMSAARVFAVRNNAGEDVVADQGERVHVRLSTARSWNRIYSQQLRRQPQFGGFRDLRIT